jgi:putative membrane protein
MHEETQGVNVSNELARERSRQAADRTLMAWVRTALSLIGFGFGVAQFRDILVRTELVARRSPEYPSTALYFGLAFISLGVLGLLAATIQHWRILQHIKQDEFHYSGFRPLVFIMATALITIGVLAFIATVAQRSLWGWLDNARGKKGTYRMTWNSLYKGVLIGEIFRFSQPEKIWG